MAHLQRTHLLRIANRAVLDGRLGEARQACSQVLARNGEDADALSVMILIGLEGGDPEAAEQLARKCIERQPGSVHFHTLLGVTVARQGRFDEALEHYTAALRIDPANLRARAGRANVFQQKGDYARGLAELAPIVDEGREDADVAIHYARLQTLLKDYDSAIAVVERALARRKMTAGQRSLLLFALGKAQEKSGLIDEAFASYTEANRLVRIGGYNFDKQITDDKMLLDMPASAFEGLPRAARTEGTVIFIVAMPRSGTTLTEFILDAHPMVQGVGECTGMTDLSRDLTLKIGSTLGYPGCMTDLEQSDVDRLGVEYMEMLRDAHPPAEGVSCFADKSLDNYRHVGLISLVLPGSRIVWVRRNELDNCLACFGEPLAARNQPWSVDLRQIGIMHRMHVRLMEHWRQALDIPILELHYEQLVADPEPETRRLIEFCGLPWDDACLQHHKTDRAAMTLSQAQVRQPIYTSSVSRAAKFERHLGPLHEGLAAGDRV